MKDALLISIGLNNKNFKDYFSMQEFKIVL